MTAVGERFADQLRRDPHFLERFIGEREAADFLGHSVRCLQNWRLRGGGPPYIKISGRSIRYRRQDIVAWGDAHLQRRAP